MKKKSESLKRILALVMNSKSLHLSFFGLALMLVSCGRCQKCTYDSGGSETLCETEFDTPSQYELAIDEAEANNATCTSTGGL